MRHAVAAVAAAFALAACTTAPKKPASPAPVAAPAPGPATGTARRVSPYAPAQEDMSKRGDYVAGGLYAPHIRDSAPGELHDVDLIPEPDVVALPRSRYGNRTPYAVLGKQYVVMDDTRGYVEEGIASFYGSKFHGRRTSNLEVYDMYAFSAAHRSLPLPSFARVTNLDTGKSVVVRVNDRGPFHEGRLIDLSFAAASKLGITRRGTGRVEVRALQPGEAPVFAGAAPAVPAAPSVIDGLVAALPVAQAQAGGRPDAAAPPAVPVAPPVAGREYRFDMHQNGRSMSADEFDAWMRQRQVRVATGRPGAPVAAPAAVTPAAPVASTPNPPPAATGAPVTLQVAAFGARANAERALDMLRDAGIGQARVEDATSGGKPVWRLRVATASSGVDALASRLVGLGFGPPQRVRD